MWNRRILYDVFLNFRGEDTRKNFVDHLYAALVQRGIYTFKDDVRISKGQEIELQLYNKIDASRIAIVVFSKNYACSSWCLDELVQIMLCRKSMPKYTVIPVFYDVDPSDVRNRRGTFRENYFATHKATVPADTMRQWSTALFEASNLAGWDVNNTANGHEAECIKQIVEVVSNIVEETTSFGDEKLVGVQRRLFDVKSLLQLGSCGFRVIGIWGMGGIGKTSIAGSVFNDICRFFEGSSFIENVTKTSEIHGLISLQEKLLSDVLLDKELKIKSIAHGQKMISERLANKNVLIVLDDVNHANQIEALRGYSSWFDNSDNNWLGQGSRVIITTRDRQVLLANGVGESAIYDAALLNDEEAIQLFSRYAFGRDTPEKDYEEPSQSVVSYAAGLPLTLKVLGGYLCGRDRVLWTSALNKLQKIPEKETMKVLEISYNGLEDVEKEVFLDIACFFRGWKKELVVRILDSCGFASSIILDDLKKKSLISMNNHIDMHDLIQEMGRNVVRQVPYGHCNRLWCSTEVAELLIENVGMEDMQAIVVQPKYSNPEHIIAEANFMKMNECRSLNNEAFTKMKKLRLLYLKHNIASFQGPSSLPSELRWLTWNDFPLEYLPDSYHANKLVGLELCKSKIVQLWKSEKYLEHLKFLNLNEASFLTKTPDLSNMPNLVSAKFNLCSNLREVQIVGGVHNELVCLELVCCERLESFPDTIEMRKLQKLNMLGCSRLKRLPEFIGNMDCLSDLILPGTSVEELPSSIGNLSKLNHLDVGHCRKLRSLPHTIGNLQRLKTINVSFCSGLSQLPDYLEDMKCLRKINIRSCPRCQIDNLPLGVLYKTNVKQKKNIKIRSALKCRSNTQIQPETALADVNIRASGSNTSMKETPKSTFLSQGSADVSLPETGSNASMQKKPKLSFWPQGSADVSLPETGSNASMQEKPKLSFWSQGSADISILASGSNASMPEKPKLPFWSQGAKTI